VSVQALTGASEPATTAAPVVNQAREPASVRNGSAAVQKAYQSALAFEQVLVEQLAKSLTATAGLGGEEEGGEGSNPEASEISSTLPQTLSASVMSAGGLGMAAQMTQQMQAHSGEANGGAVVVSPSSGGSEVVAAVTGASPAATSASSGGTSA
jgi:Rod binding domain-containing protein